MDDCFTGLCTFHGNLETRWATFENPSGAKGGACRGNDGRKRSAARPLAAGESLTLAEVSGASGMIRRIWMTITWDRETLPQFFRGLRLEIYWDGAPRPAVSAPLGDFFGMGLGRKALFQNALFACPETRSFNCIAPMPFRSGMRVVVTNEARVPLRALFYEIDYTLGDEHSPGMLYFHSHWRRENPTTLGRDYEFLPRVEGRGRLLGVNFGVRVDNQTYGGAWWGEGEVKVYLDGDQAHPTLCGTGTEDYIGTAWGQGHHCGPYQGCHLADRSRGEYCFYRLHIPDPVYFRADIRATIQQIGNLDPESIRKMQAAGLTLRWGGQEVDMNEALAKGTGGFERRDDWSSCVWFYLDQAVNALPALAPVDERLAGLPEIMPANS